MNEKSMKNAGTVLAILFLVIPTFSHAATIAELQSQLQVLMAQLATLQTQTKTPIAPQSGAVSCPNLTRNLFRGSRGSDAAQLQQFLISQNHLASDSTTGFFGAMTEAAVKQFQCKKMNICSGSPNTNGYGAVGPRTRAAMASACMASITPTVPITSVAPTTSVVPTNPTVPIMPTTPPTSTSCTPLAPQTQTLACLTGQTGSITQTRTSSCTIGATMPTWGAWVTTTNTCVSGTSGAIETLDYFLTTHTDKSLTGSHALNQTISGQTTYFVKWDASSYETYSWDNNYIYLKEDHSGAPNPGSYIFSDGRWLKRSMQVGETIQATNNSHQTFTVNTNSSCTPTDSAPFPYSMILERRVPNYNMGGTLGVQDVIVVKYDYRYGAFTDYEKMYYAKGWGLVKWELYRNDQLIQTSTFNQISNTAPIAPNLQSECRYTDVTPIGTFIESLYRNVLGRTSDSNGKAYYVNALNQNKTVAGCRLLLTDFYTSTEFNQRTISDQEFVTSLYRASFGREPDSNGLNFWVQKLSSLQMTRVQLRDSFITHAETEAYCTKVVT